MIIIDSNDAIQKKLYLNNNIMRNFWIRKSKWNKYLHLIPLDKKSYKFKYLVIKFDGYSVKNANEIPIICGEVTSKTLCIYWGKFWSDDLNNFIKTIEEMIDTIEKNKIKITS
mgnify:CR=1 FL=1